MGRSSEEKFKFFFLILPFWELCPKRLKTHFLFCTSLYCHCVQIFMGILEIYDQLFRFKFDNFMVFWKIKFSKKQNLKFLAAEFLEFSLTIYLNTEKYHNKWLKKTWTKIRILYQCALVYIIGIKPAPGNNESDFKKVGAIPCGCNTK